jgi:hypothetical protein
MRDQDQKLIWENYNKSVPVSKPKFTSKEIAALMGMDKNTPKPTKIKINKEEEVTQPGGSGGAIFDLPYTNGNGGAPRPDMIDYDNYQGSFYIQQFGPEAATRPLKYPNHNPAGAKLEPGEFFEVHINWEWYGSHEPDSFTTPGTEPQIDNPQIERIVDEDERDVPESHPVWQHATKIVDDHFLDAGESTMNIYGWEPESEY